MAKEDKQGFSVTLSSGKVVLLREPLIRHQEMAMQIASTKTSNETMMGMMGQKELLKQLIISIGGKELKPIELEDFDSIFTYAEYMQMQHVLIKITGGKELGEFQTEIVTYGGK